MKAHDIQFHKKNRVSGNQLGDDPIWDFDPTATAVTILMALFGFGLLLCLVSHG